MKKRIVLIALMSLCSAPLYADDTHHPGAPQAAAVKAGNQPENMDQRIKEAQAIMAKMRKQMNEIRHARNPQERHKLMREHMQTMQEGMNMMRSMGNGMMMGGGMQSGNMMGGMGGGMQGNGSMAMGGNMGTGSDGMMELRMEMMTEMMEQMMQHEQMWQNMPSK